MSSPLDDVPLLVSVRERRAAGRHAVARAWGYVGLVFGAGTLVALAVLRLDALPAWVTVAAAGLAIALAATVWVGRRALPLWALRLALVALAAAQGVVLAGLVELVVADLTTYVALTVGVAAVAWLLVYTAFDLQRLPRLACDGASADELERAALLCPVSLYADAGRPLAQLVVELVPYVFYGVFWLLARAIALLLRAVMSLLGGLGW